MEFRTGLRFSSRMVAVSGLLSLLLTREVPDWMTGPVLVFALLGIFMDRVARPVLAKRALAALVVAGFAFAVVDFLYVGGSLIIAGADFLILLLLFRLLSLSEYKDYVQLYIISFFLLLSSTALSTEFSFLLSFMLFFVSLAWAMTLLTMKGESEAVTGAEPRWRMSRKFFVSTALLTLGSTVFTLAIFLVIPRVGIGYFSKRAGGFLRISGFSDSVRLGSMGQELLDPSAVMRVQMEGSPMPESEFYWRGKVFDYFNGSSWEDRSAARKAVENIGSSFYLRRGEIEPAGCVTQKILLEPLESPTLFMLYPAFEIMGNFRALTTENSGAVTLAGSPNGRTAYTVCSKAAAPRDKTRDLPGKKARDMGPYLQINEGMDDLRALAGQITSRGDAPANKAMKVQEYLRSNYAYSLDPGGKGGDDPVNDFLFRVKKGYCEHFATAMVLLLRASGVPARLVSGFMGGEWNAYGRYYLVRAQDAHTWVEAYMGGAGWERFDPTPPSHGAGKGAFLGAIGRLTDYLRFKWDRYIVFYSLRDQSGLAKTFLDRAGALRERLSGLFSLSGRGNRRSHAGIIPGAGKWSRAAAGAAVVLVLLTVLALLLKRYSKGAVSKRGPGGFYRRMLIVLAKKGIRKDAPETPLEFAGRVLALCGPAYSMVGWMTELYNRARFGETAIGKEDMEKVEAALAALKSAPPPP